MQLPFYFIPLLIILPVLVERSIKTYCFELWLSVSRLLTFIKLFLKRSSRMPKCPLVIQSTHTPVLTYTHACRETPAGHFVFFKQHRRTENRFTSSQGGGENMNRQRAWCGTADPGSLIYSVAVVTELCFSIAMFNEVISNWLNAISI